jgi:hypothetical protein
MKMVADYLEKAISFEQMAEKETDAKLKENLLNQAAAYRKLASERVLKAKLVPLHRSK